MKNYLQELAEQLYEYAENKDISLQWNGGHESLVGELAKITLDMPENPGIGKLFVESPLVYGKIILLSGGMDSTILWHKEANDDTLGIYVGLQTKYAIKEKEVLDNLKIPYQFIQGSLSELPDWQHIIPARNLLLIGLAEQYIQHEGEIWLGVVAGESNNKKGDKSELFFRLCEELIWRTKHKKIYIRTMKEKTKNDWLKWFIKTYPEKKEIILHTVTCFEGTQGTKGCGRCQACYRKWIAIRYCKLDTEPYFEDSPAIAGTKHRVKYIEAFKKALEEKDFSHYTKERCEQDLQVIYDSIK